MSRVVHPQEPRPSLGLVVLTSLAVLAIVFVGLVVPAASAAGLASPVVEGPVRGNDTPTGTAAPTDPAPGSGNGRCSTLYDGNSVRRICLHRVVAQ